MGGRGGFKEARNERFKEGEVGRKAQKTDWEKGREKRRRKEGQDSNTEKKGNKKEGKDRVEWIRKEGS